MDNFCTQSLSMYVLPLISTYVYRCLYLLNEAAVAFMAFGS